MVRTSNTGTGSTPSFRSKISGAASYVYGKSHDATIFIARNLLTKKGLIGAGIVGATFLGYLGIKNYDFSKEDAYKSNVFTPTSIKRKDIKSNVKPVKISGYKGSLDDYFLQTLDDDTGVKIGAIPDANDIFLDYLPIKKDKSTKRVNDKSETIEYIPEDGYTALLRYGKPREVVYGIGETPTIFSINDKEHLIYKKEDGKLVVFRNPIYEEKSNGWLRYICEDGNDVFLEVNVNTYDKDSNRPGTSSPSGPGSRDI